MRGENELVMNHLALLKAVEEYLNSSVLFNSHAVVVTGMERRTIGGGYAYAFRIDNREEVRVRQVMNALNKKPPTPKPARPTEGQGEPVATAEHHATEEGGTPRESLGVEAAGN